MPTAENAGVSIDYERRGPPPEDAETVLLVEGLGYARWMWRWQVEALAETYHVLLPDNRGTGDSDTPEGPYDVAEMAADLVAVVDDAGVAAAHVVGASMGGMIAMQLALDTDRVRSLSLLCTSPGGEDAVPIPDETLASMFDVPADASPREAIRHKMRPAMTDAFFEANDGLVAEIVEWRLETDAPPAARRAQAAAVDAFDVSDRLGEIAVPTLVLHGTDDRVVPVGNGELLAARIPGARARFVDGGAHLLFIEHAERVTDELLGFLADV